MTIRYFPDEPGGGAAPESPARRGASVSLRQGGDAGDIQGGLMDPANQSLSDAIRITFRILQLGMLVLAELYILSGFETVREGEKGVRLLFGRIDAQSLEPGFHASFPFPMGEVVKVNAGANQTRVDDAYWINLPAGTPKDKPVDQLVGSTSIAPSTEFGTLMTGDGSLVHSRVTAVWRRSGTAAYAQNIHPDHEDRLVRMALQRGAVHAVAGMTIDELLKPGASGAGGVAATARGVAQETLDALKSGIVIDTVAFEQTTPPLYCKTAFAEALTAEANANKKIAEARAQANRTLSEAAGEAATRRVGAKGEEIESLLVASIDRYERALSAGEGDKASGVLDTINAMLEGQAVEVDGVRVENKTSGAAAGMIFEAKQYRSEIVGRRRAEMAIFNAKLEQFRSNPLVMLHREWHEAYAKVLESPTIQVMLLPPGTSTLELLLNRDPDVLREIEKRRNEAEQKEAEEKRQKMMDEAKFKTNPLTTAPS